MRIRALDAAVSTRLAPAAFLPVRWADPSPGRRGLFDSRAGHRRGPARRGIFAIERRIRMSKLLVSTVCAILALPVAALADNDRPVPHNQQSGWHAPSPNHGGEHHYDRDDHDHDGANRYYGYSPTRYYVSPVRYYARAGSLLRRTRPLLRSAGLAITRLPRTTTTADITTTATMTTRCGPSAGWWSARWSATRSSIRRRWPPTRPPPSTRRPAKTRSRTTRTATRT